MFPLYVVHVSGCLLYIILSANVIFSWGSVWCMSCHDDSSGTCSAPTPGGTSSAPTPGGTCSAPTPGGTCSAPTTHLVYMLNMVYIARGTSVSVILLGFHPKMV